MDKTHEEILRSDVQKANLQDYEKAREIVSLGGSGEGLFLA